MCSFQSYDPVQYNSSTPQRYHLLHNPGEKPMGSPSFGLDKRSIIGVDCCYVFVVNLSNDGGNLTVPFYNFLLHRRRLHHLERNFVFTKDEIPEISLS